MDTILNLFQAHITELVTVGINALMIYFRQKWAPSKAHEIK